MWLHLRPLCSKGLPCICFTSLLFEVAWEGFCSFQPLLEPKPTLLEGLPRRHSGKDSVCQCRHETWNTRDMKKEIREAWKRVSHDWGTQCARAHTHTHTLHYWSSICIHKWLVYIMRRKIALSDENGRERGTRGCILVPILPLTCVTLSKLFTSSGPRFPDLLCEIKTVLLAMTTSSKENI